MKTVAYDIAPQNKPGEAEGVGFWCRLNHSHFAGIPEAEFRAKQRRIDSETRIEIPEQGAILTREPSKRDEYLYLTFPKGGHVDGPLVYMPVQSMSLDALWRRRRWHNATRAGVFSLVYLLLALAVISGNASQGGHALFANCIGLVVSGIFLIGIYLNDFHFRIPEHGDDPRVMIDSPKSLI